MAYYSFLRVSLRYELADGRHFVPEIFVPAARSAAAALGNEGIANEDMLPSRIIFPRHTASPSWRDGKGLSGCGVWLY